MNAAHRKARAHGRLCDALSAKGYRRAAAFHQDMMRRRQAEADIAIPSPEAIRAGMEKSFSTPA